VSPEAAIGELTGILERIRPGTTARTPNAPPRFALVRTDRNSDTTTTRALVATMAAALVLLLIATVNVTSIVLARTAARRHEIAVRLTIGAARGRIVRQLLTETLLSALLAGLAGILLANWMVRGFTALAVTLDRTDLGVQLSFPRLQEVAIGGPAIAFAFVAALAVGVFVGLVPATWVASDARRQPLSERAGIESGGGTLRGRGLLVISEIALATMLLIGGALIVRSFANLSSVNAGFNPSGVLTFQIAVPMERYPGARMLALAEQVTAAVREIPGVTHAAYARQLPLVALRESAWFRRTPVLPNPPPRQADSAPDARLVSRDYFATMGIAIVAGRGFDDNDRDRAPRAASSALRADAA
jgi:putative ABC transport system permease protein